MKHEHENTLVIRTFNDMVQATIAKEKLAEAGIDSFLNDENVMGLDPVGGVELKIFEKDREAAEKLLTS